VPQLLFFLVVATTFVVFLPTLGAGFVNWDDDMNFTTNPGFRGLGWDNLRWMFTTPLLGHWIPLTWLTLGANYAVGGMNPFGYHLVNVLVHALSAGVFFLIAGRLLRAALGGFGGWPVTLGATLTALIFGVHPLRVESVAWITERRDVLCTLFYLVALWAYLRGVERGPEGERILAGRWRALAYVAFIASLLSKSMSMTFCLTLLLLDVYPLRRLGLGWRHLAMEKLPFALLGGAAAVGALLSVSRGATWTGFEEYGLPARLAMAAYSFCFYPWKLVWPVGLTPLYELPAHVSPLASQFLVPLIVVPALTGALYLLRHRWPAALAAWIHSLIVLAPVAGFVHSGYQLAHDRYSYLSGLGFALLAGGGLVWTLRARAARRIGAGVAASVAAAALVMVIGLAVGTWQQSRVWHDSENLWRSAIDADPTCMLCYSNLGHAMLAGGRYREGEALFRHAIALRPDRPAPWNNLGTALALQQRYAEAEPPYARAVELSDGQFRDAVANLGRLRVVRGRYGEAIPLLRRANAMKPGNPEVVESFRLALKNQGASLAESGRPVDAEALFREGLDLLGDDHDLFVNLGRSRLDQGRAAEAVGPLERAVQMKARNPLARMWLARAYARAGVPDRARAELEALASLDPVLGEKVKAELGVLVR
jgi:Flp pilus assembly protein TadD